MVASAVTGGYLALINCSICSCQCAADMSPTEDLLVTSIFCWGSVFEEGKDER